MNAQSLPARVLLIEDDEDDYILIRDTLSSFSPPRFELQWAADFDSALDVVANGSYDACLLDYRLGDRNGLELLEAVGSTCRMPVIFLTGLEDYTLDFRAMRAGAADYLVKDHISPLLLERSIRYAMDRKQKEEELRRFAQEQERLNRELSRTLEELQTYREHLESLVEERTRELKQAKEEAESANRAKSEFLANMSHEIRTPISCILGTADMALSLGPDGDQKECLLTIKDVTDSLMKIIDDILDLSKIEAGKMEMRQEEFDLRSLMASTVNALRSQAEKKGIELSSEISPNVPPLLVGAAAGLRQVLINLIGNGLKFTEQGKVNVKVERAEDDGLNSGVQLKLRFSVSDTGIGIPQGKQRLIFDPFRQADSTFSKKYGGTGLGLAICKQLVETMHGGIRVESKEGEGATFYFTAVFQEASGCTGLSKESSRTDEIPGRLLFILLAEDNLMNQKFLRHWLESAGHSVVTATNGREALEALEKISFDLVLMDVQMPEMDGIEATRMIRSSKSEFINPDIPIIALTAYAMKGDRERILEAGMDGYVPKPLEFEELLRVMSDVFSKKERVTHRTDATGQTVNLEKLRSAYEGNMKLLKELIGDFESSLPHRLYSLKAALESKDLKAVMKIAHTLVGSVGTLQAPRSVEYARKLEEAARSGDLGQAIAFSDKLDKELHYLLAVLIKESESI